MAQRAVYTGSFDPITQGHVDVIQRIAKQFPELIVLVSFSAEKKYLFSTEERKVMVEQALKGIANVKVDVHEGLTVNYMKKAEAKVIVRGLRAVVDFEYEMTMANMNKKLAPDIETMLVFASPEAYYISSRGVKEVAKYGGSLDGLVPENVKAQLLKKMKA